MRTLEDGERSFIQHEFHAVDTNYFYPASIVKLPASIFAAEKIHALRTMGIDLYTRVSIDSSFSCQKAMKTDVYTNDSIPTIGAFIEKALVVSDNPSYSRLYEFVGPEYFARRLSEMNMPHAQIVHRFSSCDSAENRHTNGFRFLSPFGETLYSQPAAYMDGPRTKAMPHMGVGKMHVSGGKTIKAPKDFSNSNALPLRAIHAILMELIYPESQSFEYSISESQRAYLRRALTICPKDSNNRKIAGNKEFHDNYTNYFFFGNENKERTSNLEVCNIVGLSYGFMTDVAYVYDPDSQVEFFLSATLYCNESDVIGSGNYEYSAIGFPFMKELSLRVLDALRNKH
ncbi:MAG: serine hydrolase [Flavobacteriales bacterium]